MNRAVLKRDLLFTVMGGAALLTGVAAAQTDPPRPAPDPALGPLEGVRRFMTSFQPAPGEASLLAYARQEGLDWAATQNLFGTQLTDPGNHYLEWRGLSNRAGGAVFTTVRAATFLRAGQALLVLNREWCAAGQCQVRHVFAWQSAGMWKVVPEASVIPALRDEEFTVGRAPACLRGVPLGVQYLPARLGTTLNVLPLVPEAARRACEAAGVNLSAATRPVTLNWTVSVGKFRR